jgi:hypothetical protein
MNLTIPQKVGDNFKIQAYALILLRGYGLPYDIFLRIPLFVALPTHFFFVFQVAFSMVISIRLKEQSNLLRLKSWSDYFKHARVTPMDRQLITSRIRTVIVLDL